MQEVTIPKSILNEPGYLGERFSKPMAWIDLQLLAEDGKVAASYRELASRWKWSATKVIRFLDDLETKRFAKRSVDTFKGCLTKQLIVLFPDDYEASNNNGQSFEETFQSGSPLSPSISPSVPPTPPSNSLYTPPISPSENLQQSVQDTSAYAREGGTQPPTPFPYPAPFILSSVEREMCRFGRTTEAQCKRNHLEANLLTIAREVNMNEAEQKKFLDYWCCSQDGNEIRAESDAYFDLRYRAENWMKKAKSEEKPQKSRLEQYADKSQQLTQFINEFYGNSPDGRAEDGALLSPDEQ